MASSILTFSAFAANPQSKEKAAPDAATTKFSGAHSGVPSSAQVWRLRQATFYKRNWGVDIIGMRLVSSGHMLEFHYRVLDASKARALNNKKATPYLIDQKTGTRLTVPTMEKIGQLRQTADPKQGQTYWMIFANEGKVVRVGDRVDLEIGTFIVRGLVVQ